MAAAVGSRLHEVQAGLVAEGLGSACPEGGSPFPTCIHQNTILTSLDFVSHSPTPLHPHFSLSLSSFSLSSLHSWFHSYCCVRCLPFSFSPHPSSSPSHSLLLRIALSLSNLAFTLGLAFAFVFVLATALAITPTLVPLNSPLALTPTPCLIPNSPR